MAPGKRIQGLQSYRTPLTGHETHKSGFEVTQQRIFEKKVVSFEYGLFLILLPDCVGQRKRNIKAD